MNTYKKGDTVTVDGKRAVVITPPANPSSASQTHTVQFDDGRAVDVPGKEIEAV